MATHLLRVELSVSGDVALLRLSGTVDADARFPTPPQAQIIISTTDVNRLTSVGVRHWIAWLERLAERGSEVFLVDCAPDIVVQLNQIQNFAGHGKLVSFYMPYDCPTCDRQSMVLMRTAVAKEQQPFRAPVRRCEVCDGVLEFDALEDGYFAFLQRYAAPEVPPAVAAVIDDQGNRGEIARIASTSFPSLSTIDSALTPSSAPDLTGPHMPRIEHVSPTDRHQSAPPPRRGPSMPLIVLMVLMLAGAIGLALVLLLRGT
ncbi:MAG: hypothetical protein KC503_34460 [Myxococcales bacterium]|nr:hypothetical protein [Myxococcales bacterium]